MTAADVEASLARIGAEPSVSRLLNAACAELVTLLDVSRVTLSRMIGDLLVELGHHDRSGHAPPLELFLLPDYPLTQEVIATGEPRRVDRTAPDADPAEADLLRRLGFDSLLMLPLPSRGHNWGLVEIYANDRAFDDAEIERARRIVERVGELLADLESRS